MKPFDFERAKAGAKLMTRDGRPARFVAHAPDVEDENYRVLCVVQGDLIGYYEDGRYYRTEETVRDLFMAPEHITRYVNLFPDGVAYWFDTEAEARAGLNARALKIAVPVTFEV